MAKSKKTGSKIQLAEQLYMSGTMSQEEIADMLKVHPNTISNWVNDGNWKLIKGANDSARGKIVSNTLLRIQQITEIKPDQDPGLSAKDADMLLKLSKVVEQFSPNKQSVSGQIETIRDFMAYLYQEDAELAKMVNDHSREFVQNCINNAIQQ